MVSRKSISAKYSCKEPSHQVHPAPEYKAFSSSSITIKAKNSMKKNIICKVKGRGPTSPIPMVRNHCASALSFASDGVDSDRSVEEGGVVWCRGGEGEKKRKWEALNFGLCVGVCGEEEGRKALGKRKFIYLRPG
jgi:hypothetical protein